MLTPREKYQTWALIKILGNGYKDCTPTQKYKTMLLLKFRNLNMVLDERLADIWQESSKWEEW